MTRWLPPIARLLSGGRHIPFDIRAQRRQEVEAQRRLTETRGRVEVSKAQREAFEKRKAA